MEHTLLENLDEMDRMHQKHFGEETAKEFSEAIAMVRLLLATASRGVGEIARIKPNESLLLTASHEVSLSSEEVSRIKEGLKAAGIKGVILERLELVGIFETEPKVEENEA